jgi:cytoskeletal protein RodZ
MSRDTIKTFIGLIIIGGIVVATFLYGNSQRQTQLTHDQEVKKQQDAKVAAAAKSPSPSAVASATPTVASTTNNTSPVKSPASNSIQGNTTPTSTPVPSSTPSPTPGVVAGASIAPTATPLTVPDTGGTGAALPQTGPEAAGALGLSSIGIMLLAVRRSRQAMLKAARRH